MIRWLSALAAAAILAGAQTPPPAQPPPPRPHPAPATVPAPAPAPVPGPASLKYPPLRPVEIPQVAAFTLPNGMKLFLLEDHETPVVHGTARIRTGNLFDPADKVGLAAMTGMVMRSGGTRELTAQELDRKLEDLAGGVDSAIGETWGEVSFVALADNADDVLATFRDVLTAPAFRSGAVELAKLQLRNLVAHGNDTAAAVLAREFPGILYGDDTPYGWSLNYDRLDRIAGADLQTFYKRYFFPKNVVLAVWGDFDTSRMKDRLEQLFSGWTVEQPPVPEFPKVTARPAPGIFLAKSTGALQTSFAIGHLSGKIGDKDYPALTVMAAILGGGSGSRLARAGRTASILQIAAEWGAAFDHPGLFEISGAASSFATNSAIKSIRQEIDRIRTAEVGDEELRLAKETALNQLVFAADTRKKFLNRILTYEYFGYPADFLPRYQAALGAVTRADVLRVAKEFLRPADLTILVVGNPDDFTSPLESLGDPVREIDMAIPEPKLHVAATDTASLEQGKRILQRVQQAVGGAGKIAAVKDYTAVTEVRFAAAAGGATYTETDRWLAPGNLREDLDTPAGGSALYCDGKSGWITRGRASGLLQGPALKAAQGDVYRSYFSLLLSDRIAGRIVSALDENTLEITGPEGLVVRVAVDPETGLPQRFSYESPTPAGPVALVQETIAEFGQVAGLRVPFQISARQNGNPYTETFVKDFKVNSALVLTDLERRP